MWVYLSYGEEQICLCLRHISPATRILVDLDRYKSPSQTPNCSERCTQLGLHADSHPLIFRRVHTTATQIIVNANCFFSETPFVYQTSSVDTTILELVVLPREMHFFCTNFNFSSLFLNRGNFPCRITHIHAIPV